MDVKLIELKKMKIASFQCEGPGAEAKVHKKLISWAMKNDLLKEEKKYHLYGFDNPMMTKEKPNGYELWLPIDRDIKESDGIKIKNFEGGIFLAREMTLKNFFTPDLGWKLLHPNLPWMKENKYEIDWDKWPIGLEETIVDKNDIGKTSDWSLDQSKIPMILYMRIKKVKD